jgi:hypothetical protein
MARSICSAPDSCRNQVRSSIEYAYEWAAQVVEGSIEMNAADIDYDPRMHPWTRDEHSSVMESLCRILDSLRRKSGKRPKGPKGPNA